MFDSDLKNVELFHHSSRMVILLKYNDRSTRTPEIVKLLLAYGANPNAQTNTDLWTPLHVAVFYGVEEVLPVRWIFVYIG